jgi:ferredoxin
METITSNLLLILGLGWLLAFTAFARLSFQEGEPRATRLSLFAALLGSVPLFLSSILPPEIRSAVLIVLAGLTLIGIVLFPLPIGKVEKGHDIPQKRVDERDIMFARARLDPGSPEYEAYYTSRPENLESDNKIRSLPGLLSPDAQKANARVFAVADASFDLTEAVREEVDGVMAPNRIQKSPVENTAFLKDLTLYLGARSVGIAELKPYHVYSHIGRGSGTYGDPLAVDQSYAIAFAVEMDHAVMQNAPNAPVVMESAKQYVEAAKIALQLGYFIRSQGYPARAHIDGNYRVIAPLVARDAGLGEIGRMGLLMTPELGPRVRLAVVTTDMPLNPDPRTDGRSMIDFCRICLKCAENCPSKSIAFDDRQEIDGALRWRINPDTCFRYWNVIGTDCALCMAVCPYSHPDNWGHNTMRWAIQRSGAARRAALWLDDLFYGRKPVRRPAADWIPN